MTFAGIAVVPREAKDNAYATFWGASQVYYGRRANGEYRAYSHDVCWCPINKNMAMLVLQTNPVGVEPFLCRNFLLFNKFA